MKRLFKSERHYGLSQQFPADLVSSGALEPPRHARPTRARRYVLLVAACLAIGAYRLFCA